MKKFKFRLQTLLKIRQFEEDRKKRVVGSLVTEINQQQREALHLGQSLQQEGRALKEQYLTGDLDLQRIGHYRSYVTAVHQAIGKRIETVAQIQGRLSHARSELHDAMRETRTLETLKDRQLKNYNRSLQKIETGEQDEISANQHRRGQAADAFGHTE
jgi:flagellar export protein FliJ